MTVYMIKAAYSLGAIAAITVSHTGLARCCYHFCLAQRMVDSKLITLHAAGLATKLASADTCLNSFAATDALADSTQPMLVALHSQQLTFSCTVQAGRLSHCLLFDAVVCNNLSGLVQMHIGVWCFAARST